MRRFQLSLKFNFNLEFNLKSNTAVMSIDSHWLTDNNIVLLTYAILNKWLLLAWLACVLVEKGINKTSCTISLPSYIFSYQVMIHDMILNVKYLRISCLVGLICFA